MVLIVDVNNALKIKYYLIESVSIAMNLNLLMNFIERVIHVKIV
jgi:hypothetical protein